jgi:phytoene dehydrogenase-like protein
MTAGDGRPAAGDGRRTANRFDAIVIGAGSNGLVAAAALAKGRRVIVLEAAQEIGGLHRSSEFAPGFRSPISVDTGWLPPTVVRGLGLQLHGITQPLTGASVAGDDEVLTLPCEPTRAEEEIARYSVRDAERWPAFIDRMGKLAGFLEALYQLPPPDIDAATSFGELTPLLGLGRKFRALGRANMTELLRVLPMSLQDLLDDWFENPLLKAAIAAGGVRDIRQGPRSGGTSFVLLHHLAGARPGSIRARPWWRHTPDGFVRTIADAAARLGVTVRTGAVVSRILVDNDAVTGVALSNGDELAAPIVLSTADPSHTLLDLVDPVWLDPEFLHAVQNIKFRGCTAIVRYALDRVPNIPDLEDPATSLASTVSLSPTLDRIERAYDAAKYGGVADEPHVEISVPTFRWPSFAPVGKHVLLARVQYTPYQLRDGAIWDDARSCELGETVTRTIARVVPQFAETILHREILTPPDIETRFGVTEGAMTHGELTLDQILFMRPVAGWGRYAMPIDGLYLGGSGAHPGPGVLGGAGWLAAKRIK